MRPRGHADTSADESGPSSLQSSLGSSRQHEEDATDGDGNQLQQQHYYQRQGAHDSIENELDFLSSRLGNKFLSPPSQFSNHYDTMRYNQGMITIESGRLQGRQLHPHHMVRQPRSRSAASLPIAGLDTAGQPHPPGGGVAGLAPNGMPPNVLPGGGSASAAVAAAAARRESAVSVTSLSVYDAMGGGGGGQMTGADHNLTFLQYM